MLQLQTGLAPQPVRERHSLRIHATDQAGLVQEQQLAEPPHVKGWVGGYEWRPNKSQYIILCACCL